LEARKRKGSMQNKDKLATWGTLCKAEKATMCTSHVSADQQEENGVRALGRAQDEDGWWRCFRRKQQAQAI